MCLIVVGKIILLVAFIILFLATTLVSWLPYWYSIRFIGLSDSGDTMTAVYVGGPLGCIVPEDKPKLNDKIMLDGKAFSDFQKDHKKINFTIRGHPLTNSLPSELPVPTDLKLNIPGLPDLDSLSFINVSPGWWCDMWKKTTDKERIDKKDTVEWSSDASAEERKNPVTDEYTLGGYDTAGWLILSLASSIFFFDIIWVILSFCMCCCEQCFLNQLPISTFFGTLLTLTSFIIYAASINNNKFLTVFQPPVAAHHSSIVYGFNFYFTIVILIVEVATFVLTLFVSYLRKCCCPVVK